MAEQSVKNKKNTKFAKLFKKYRLRSDISSLSSFADLLADEGFYHETSVFNKWQVGTRTPSSREILMATINIFAKQKGMQTIEEANEFVESLGLRGLDINESTSISKSFNKNYVKDLPILSNEFIGKEKILKNISWDLLNQKKVFVYGLPGSGKTYTAIHLANKLKNHFSDGIFWFRADLKDCEAIVNELLEHFGFYFQNIYDYDDKINKLNNFLSKRNILIIIDNLDNKNFIDLAIKLKSSVMITSVIKHENHVDNSLVTYKTEAFTEEEFLLLSKKILGKPFCDIYGQQLTEVYEKTKGMPILGVLFTKHIYNFAGAISEKNLIDEFLKDLFKIEYDNKNLGGMIDYLFNTLSPDTGNFLTQMCIFNGQSFGIKLASKLSALNKSETQNKLTDLCNKSIIEHISSNRFCIHPTIRHHVAKKLKKEAYVQLVNIYAGDIKNMIFGSEDYINYLNIELDNILTLFDNCFDLKLYKECLDIWSLISEYIFLKGYWEILLKRDQKIQKSFLENKDENNLYIYLIEELGRVYFLQNNNKKLKELLTRCQKRANEKKDLLLSTLILQKVGLKNFYAKKIKLAEKQLKDTLKPLQSLKMDEQLAKSYAYLGMTQAVLGKNKEAILNIKKGLNSMSLSKDTSISSFLYAYLGNAYIKIGDYTKARICHINVLKTTVKLDSKYPKAMALEGLGFIAKKSDLKMDRQAKDYFDSAIEIYNSLGINKEKRIFC